MSWSTEVLKAHELANKAREKAHAKYSGTKVGAALKIKGDERIFAGCNVEYVVNGISVCAERNAINTCVTQVGKPEIEFILVCSNTDPVLYPCGVCMQAMSEFSSPDLDIYIANKDEVIKVVKFKDLFTHQYSSLPKILDE